MKMMNGKYKCLCCNDVLIFRIKHDPCVLYGAVDAILACEKCDIVYNKPEVTLNSRVQVLSKMIDELHKENTKLVDKLKKSSISKIKMNNRIIELEKALNSMIDYSYMSEAYQDRKEGRKVRDEAIEVLTNDKKENKYGMVLNEYNNKVEVRDIKTMELLGFMNHITRAEESNFVKLHKHSKVEDIDLFKINDDEVSSKIKTIHIDIKEMPVLHYLISREDWELLNE